jgi:hypothetical protein
MPSRWNKDGSAAPEPRTIAAYLRLGKGSLFGEEFSNRCGNTIFDATNQNFPLGVTLNFDAPGPRMAVLGTKTCYSILFGNLGQSIEFLTFTSDGGKAWVTVTFGPPWGNDQFVRTRRARRKHPSDARARSTPPLPVSGVGTPI